jgi:hypothetical protein
MSEFPGNTNRSREAREPRVKPITDGELPTRRRPLGKRFAETFIQGDARSVREAVFWGLVIPKVKDVFLDAAWESLQVMLFGSSRSGRSTSGSSSYRYEARHSPDRVLRPDRDRSSMSRSARASHDFREILWETRVQAEEALDVMEAAIDQFDMVSVADLYDLAGQKAEFTDQDFGWTDLRDSVVRKVRGGYIIDMPRPHPLEK